MKNNSSEEEEVAEECRGEEEKKTLKDAPMKWRRRTKNIFEEFQ